jgi:GAF domain-containing protein
LRDSALELQTRVEALTRELEEARAGQAATAQVLRIISTPPPDNQTVFQAIVESATRICGAPVCFLDRFDGELLHFAAGHGLTPAALDAIDQTFPLVPRPGTTAAQAIASRGVVQRPDLRTVPGYVGHTVIDALNVRSGVAVPLLKDGEPIGVITLMRTEPGYFPEYQVELLKTFADQAVVAIESARLFDQLQARNREVSEAMAQQTATNEILSLISSSPIDLQPVFDMIAESSA